MKKKATALTPGERDALVLVARGLTNQEIAVRMATSVAAVKTYIHQACCKLKARNRIEAVFLALRRRIINVDEIFSLDELAEMLVSLGPARVETIARSLRTRLEDEGLRAGGGQALDADREQDHFLTRRERDVLALVARGMTNREIADALCMSVSTVRTFLYQACHKLEAGSRARAFISAVRRRAVNVDEVFSLDEIVELLDSYGPEAMETVAQMIRRKLEREPLASAAT